MDMKRLVMLMGMTTSEHDGEALNALRMANKMLRAANKSWADILTAEQRIPRGSPDWRTPPSKRKPGAAYGRTVRRERYDADRGRHTDDDIQVMLSAVASRRNTMNTMMFIASLNDQWEQRGYLTTAQYEALKQMHAGRF